MNLSNLVHGSSTGHSPLYSPSDTLFPSSSGSSALRPPHQQQQLKVPPSSTPTPTLLAPYEPLSLFSAYEEAFPGYVSPEQHHPHLNSNQGASSGGSSSSVSTASHPPPPSSSMASPTAAIVTTSDLLADSLATDPPLQPVVIGLPTSDEELAMHKRHPSLRHLTINGSNVTPETFEDGYLQFILHHDPESLGDAVDSLVYTRRKFASVPKTGDLSYTTWDIFVLVNKLHNQEIKNWSQLVGQLGLSDMMGRPQFAQRVKRWMHKYKIDYYFDYLMGIPYDFHSDDEKYTGCLLMGNYQKRPTDYTSDPHVKKRRRILYSANTATSTTMEVDDPQGTEERARRPVLLAGSRKRMRDASQSLVLAADDHHRRQDDELPLDHTVYNDQDETGDVDAPKSLDLADDKDGELDAEDQEHDFDRSAEDEEHHAISSATVTRRARASASSPSWQPDGANSTAKSSANVTKTAPDDHHLAATGSSSRVASDPDGDDDDENDDNDNENDNDDEEDELASTSSTGGSPLMHSNLSVPYSQSTPSPSMPSRSHDHHHPNHLHHHDAPPPPQPSQPKHHSHTLDFSPFSAAGPAAPGSSLTCNSCHELAKTVRSLQAHLDDMNDQWTTWKHHMDARHRDLQNQVAALIDEKEKNREQWANWRKKIANDLQSDPFS